jgi:hypothetical protein
MKKTLIAVTSCHRLAARRWGVRVTWVKDVQGADVKFFLGHAAGYTPLDDEVMLDVPDEHKGFTLKVQAVRKYAAENGYDYLWKVDDDVYVRPERLLPLSDADYIGDEKRSLLGPHCGGYCYGLSRRAFTHLLRFDPGPAGIGTEQEDRWSGPLLIAAGYQPQSTPLIVEHKSFHLAGWSQGEPPLPTNQIAAACEFDVADLLKLHLRFHQ